MTILLLWAGHNKLYSIIGATPPESVFGRRQIRHLGSRRIGNASHSTASRHVSPSKVRRTMSADSEALQAALSKLETAIKNLPDGTLSGRRDGPLVQHFTPKRDKTGAGEIFPTDDEGAYYTFNRAWERAF
ncbi:hypothetical protein C8F01DRAFT_1092691 [Mycena amicta]|nr:hypothetical protein C8F01DRAFT_1092691 [Mycena amicta]